MKTIEVVAAIIHKDHKILATQRGYGDFKDGWEFPGGKMEKGESPEAAIVREIREELEVEIEPEKLRYILEAAHVAPTAANCSPSDCWLYRVNRAWKISGKPPIFTARRWPLSSVQTAAAPGYAPLTANSPGISTLPS